MKINSLSLPHPVLGVGDDVKGEYKIDLRVALDPDRAVLIINQILFNATLEKLIDQGKALYSVEINCPKTLLRQSFVFGEDKKNIRLDANSLRDHVEVNFFINAVAEINDYKIKGANPDYEDNSFMVARGDVLAYGGRVTFMALKKWEDLDRVGSFMVIDKYNKQEGPVKYELSSDRIIIKLSQKDYERYKKSKDWPKISEIYHTAIVYPALIYALNQMFSSGAENDFKGLKWFDQLNIRLEGVEFDKIEKDKEHTPEIAQMLLARPMARTLNSIMEIISIMNQDEMM